MLLASPESAASPWVDKEVAYWCDHHEGIKQLIVVLTGGEFEWDEATGALGAVNRRGLRSGALAVHHRAGVRRSPLGARGARVVAARLAVPFRDREASPPRSAASPPAGPRERGRAAPPARPPTGARRRGDGAGVGARRLDRRGPGGGQRPSCGAPRPRRPRPADGLGGARSPGERGRPGVPPVAGRCRSRQRRRRRAVPGQSGPDRALLPARTAAVRADGTTSIRDVAIAPSDNRRILAASTGADGGTSVLTWEEAARTDSSPTETG